MAEDTAVAEALEETSHKTPGRRKNLFLVGLLVAVMLVEGIAVVVMVKTFGPQPASANAGIPGGLDASEGERLPDEAEIQVTSFRAQNEQARQVAIYDVTVWAKVLKKDAETFKALIENRSASIQDRFSSVIRAADPQLLSEPDWATLRQQFQKELSALVGDDAMVRQILIPSMVKYADS